MLCAPAAETTSTTTLRVRNLAEEDSYPDLGVYLQPDPLHRSSAAALPGPQAYAYAAGRPLVNTDPLGLLVAGTFHKSQRLLVLRDTSTGETIEQPYSSGATGEAYNDDLELVVMTWLPIPDGRFDILQDHRGRAEFYRLEAYDRPYGDDRHNATGRGQFRLHHLGSGGNEGCIGAVTNEAWPPVANLLSRTSTEEVTIRRHNWNPFERPCDGQRVKRYGSIEVVP